MTLLREKADIEWKLGADNPAPRLQLIDRDGQPANLTGATVTQHVVDGPALTIDIDDHENGVIVPAKGDLSSGEHFYKDYLMEYWVTFNGGLKQPFPERGYYRARVWRSLAT